MDKDLFHVGNCPHCMKVIFRDGIFSAEAEFLMRCPHCQKPVKVRIEKRIKITILPLGGSEQRNKPVGQSKMITGKDP